MADNILFEQANTVLVSAIRAREKITQTISGNIANADTPGYRARQAKFSSQLEAIMKGNEQGVAPRILDDGPPSGDGNTVSMHKQMAAMAENSINHHAAIKLLNKRLDALRLVISGGRR